MYRFSHHRIFDGHFISVEYVYCDVSYYSHALLKVLILKPPLKLPCRTSYLVVLVYDHRRLCTGTQGSTQAADQTTLPKAEFFPSFNFSSFSSCKTAKRRRLLVEVCCNNIEKCPLPAIMVRISSSLEGVFVFFHNLLRETFRNVIFARCGALGPSCSISSKN